MPLAARRVEFVPREQAAHLIQRLRQAGLRPTKQRLADLEKEIGPVEKLKRRFAAVATDLGSGEMTLFRSGDTGWAVQASAAVPGVFQPVTISGREYVDGGLTSPVPVRAARRLGADFVIAVDISAKPRDGRATNSFDMLLQTFAIMGQSISRTELAEAQVVIRPATGNLSATSPDDRHRAILEGEKAAAAAMPELKDRLARLRSPAPAK